MWRPVTAGWTGTAVGQSARMLVLRGNGASGAAGAARAGRRQQQQTAAALSTAAANPTRAASSGSSSSSSSAGDSWVPRRFRPPPHAARKEAKRARKADPEMERASRHQTLRVDLGDVRSLDSEGWVLHNIGRRIATAASHAGVFEHVLDGRRFTPPCGLVVAYGQDQIVHRGNIIDPAAVGAQPQVSVIPGNLEAAHLQNCTLALVDPDGLSQDELDAGLGQRLHWLVCNWDASGSSGVENADSVVPYTPPRVSEGTGFHRAVFVLLQQTGGAVDAAALGKAVAERDGAVRLAALADTHRLQPIGLAYFQSAA